MITYHNGHRLIVPDEMGVLQSLTLAVYHILQMYEEHEYTYKENFRQFKVINLGTDITDMFIANIIGELVCDVKKASEELVKKGYVSVKKERRICNIDLKLKDYGETKI